MLLGTIACACLDDPIYRGPTREYSKRPYTAGARTADDQGSTKDNTQSLKMR